MVLGVSSGLISILIFLLYISDPNVLVHYNSPRLLWLVAVALVYWISNVWFLANRNLISEDPIMFVLKDRYGKLQLVTPPDNGCIIPGVIPKSIMALHERIREETGMIIEERPISIHELISAFKEDRLIEAIGCSTSSHI